MAEKPYSIRKITDREASDPTETEKARFLLRQATKDLPKAWLDEVKAELDQLDD